MAQDDFVHFHTHSDGSNFDGIGSPSEFFELCKRHGQPALALTEHGSLRSSFEAAKAAEATGVKHIPGCEFYLAEDALARGLTEFEQDEIRRAHRGADVESILRQEEAKRRERDHITVWAMNSEGMSNLLKLNAFAWTQGMYWKPRIDLNVLAAHGAGLAVSSGCPGGVIASPLRANDIEVALNRAEHLARAFGDRFVFEIMPHVPDESCVGLADKLVRLADEFGATLIATQDAHYPHAQDAHAQDVFLCVQTRAIFSDQKRFHFHAPDYWLKTRSEMEEAFARNQPQMPSRLVKLALDNTVRLAERCSYRPEKSAPGAYLAAPALPSEFASYDAWLRRLAVEAAPSRLPVPLRSDNVYGRRLLHELAAIRDREVAAYIVMIWDLLRWAREQGIPLGPGRGSSGGSLIAYLLGITQIDPVKHNLSFERFLAPGRKDLPDFDIDVGHRRVGEMVEYLKRTYGEDNVAYITAYSRFQGKGVLNDMARVFALPEGDVRAVTSLIQYSQEETEREQGTLAGIFTGTEPGMAFVERYPDVAEVSQRLEGMIRHMSVHAAGVIVSNRPVSAVVPIETREKDGKRVVTAAFDKNGVEAQGLVKVDLLGSVEQTILWEGFRRAGVDATAIDLHDAEVLAGFTNKRFAGIFQNDSPSNRRICRDFEFRRFEDIAHISAVNRPGPLLTGLADEFKQCAAGRKAVERIHPAYDRAFESTYGVPVYQEQLVNLVQWLCGYSPREADEFRRKVSKKKGLGDELPKFVAGATAAGMSPERAQKLFDSLVGFASYAFNLSHATLYALVSYQGMYLKTYHPLVWYSVALSLQQDRGKQLRLATEARSLGIAIEAPNVNFPGEGYQAIEGPPMRILGGLGDINGVGAKAAEVIGRHAPYASLLDFVGRTKMKSRPVNLGVFRALARAHAFRDIFPHHRFLVENADKVWARLDAGEEPRVSSSLPDYTPDESLLLVGAVWPMYVDIVGRSAYSALLEQLRQETPDREFCEPGDEMLLEEGTYLALVQLGKLKIYGSGEGRNGRMAATSGDGNELVVNIDSDVLEANSSLLDDEESYAVFVVGTSRFGKHSLIAAWRYPQFHELQEERVRFLLSPPRGATSSFRQAFEQDDERRSLLIDVCVLRLLRRTDKKGRPFAYLWVAGRTALAKIFVFATRFEKRDIELLRVGKRVQMRVRLMDDGSFCLGDGPIVEVAL